MITNQKQESGNNSTNVQANGDITINNNNFVLYSIEEVSRKLLQSSFGELSDSTKKQISENQKSYFQELSEKLYKITKHQEELEKIINSPDFQYISKKAAISASRSPSIELHRNLSSLIIQRINNDDTDLKRIVYNEAISTLEKLTHHQLKILTLCFVLTKTKRGGLSTLQEFILELEKSIKPFLNFKNTNAEFDHLVYTGCADIGLMAMNFEELLKNTYPNIFKSTDKASELLKGYETIDTLQKLFKETPILCMTLTSVGIAIAISHFEQLTVNSLNIDFWIN